jgi:prophage antirepressor-like protein
MNAIEVLPQFAFEGQQVRVEPESGALWFCGVDVCSVLDLDPDAMRRLRDDEKGPRSTRTPGGVQQVTWVTEPGLYKLVMRSRKPEAERFQDWVTHEVLPAIRKTGSFAAPETFEQQVVRLMGEAQRRIEEQQKQLAAAAPKVAFVDELVDATGLLGLQATAKTLGEPPNLWIRWLRQQGHVYDRDQSTFARQDHLDAGRMVERVTVKDGRRYVQTKVTPKGLVYFSERRPGIRCARRAPVPKPHGAPLLPALGSHP